MISTNQQTGNGTANLEGVRVAQQILDKLAPLGTEPLSHEFIRKIAAEAYERGVQRAAEGAETITSDIRPATGAPANKLYDSSAADTIHNVCAALAVIDAAVLSCAEDGQPDDFSWGVSLLMITIKEALQASSMPTGAVDKRMGAMLDENEQDPVLKSA